MSGLQQLMMSNFSAGGGAAVVGSKFTLTGTTSLNHSRGRTVYDPAAGAFAYIYGNYSTVFSGYALKITGTTVSAGTRRSLGTGDMDRIGMSYDAQRDYMLICYRQDNDDEKIKATTFKVNSNLSTSQGSTITLDASGNLADLALSYADHANSHIVYFEDDDGTDPIMAQVVQIASNGNPVARTVYNRGYSTENVGNQSNYNPHYDRVYTLIYQSPNYNFDAANNAATTASFAQGSNFMAFNSGGIGGTGYSFLGAGGIQLGWYNTVSNKSQFLGRTNNGTGNATRFAVASASGTNAAGTINILNAVAPENANRLINWGYFAPSWDSELGKLMLAYFEYDTDQSVNGWEWAMKVAELSPSGDNFTLDNTTVVSSGTGTASENWLIADKPQSMTYDSVNKVHLITCMNTYKFTPSAGYYDEINMFSYKATGAS